MITHEQTPHGRFIDKTFLLTDMPQPDFINLCISKGEKMRYGDDGITRIDFPGEYDISGHNIVCYEAGDLLHYQLVIDDESVIVLQSPALLEKETLTDISTRICVDEKCKDAIERDELEGTIIVLTPSETVPE